MPHQQRYKQQKKPSLVKEIPVDQSVKPTPLEQNLPNLEQNSMDALPELPNLRNGKPSPKPPLPLPETSTPTQVTGTLSPSETKKRGAPTDRLAARAQKLYPKVVNFYASVGFLCTRWDTYDGCLLILGAEDRAKELLSVAQHHKRMLDMIERIVEGNDYVTLATGHGLVLYAMLVHHERIKGDIPFLMKLGYHESQILDATASFAPQPAHE